MKGRQRRGSEERISKAQYELYEDHKGAFVRRNQGLMIIPTLASGAHDQKNILAMMTSLRYAFLDGRYYKKYCKSLV